MNPTILNREFQHPSDGWYQIEALGEHPNRAAGVVQVIDAEAAQSIVNRFNEEAKAGRLHHGHEMLIDHEHFSDDGDKETRAYGWLQELQNRADGIYGRIRWTATGKAAVDGGDYRFFSTEYWASDAKILNEGNPRRARPLRLAGLTLTNMPNNRGQKPITNREFRHGPGGSPADNAKQNNTQRKRMKSVCTLLGLSAEADEQSVHAEVLKLKNRAEAAEGELPKLKNRVTELETQNATLLDEQVDALMDAHKVADEKVRNRLRPILATYKNRQERIDCLVEFGFNGEEKEAAKEGAKVRILNRADARSNKSTTPVDEQALAQKAEAEITDYKIRNRCSYAEARNAVRMQKPELFGLK